MAVITLLAYIGSILERRKATLSYLKSAAYTSNSLDQNQVAELAQQMKVIRLQNFSRSLFSTVLQQFVTDRKVDEEIGAVERFNGDVDDILPHIMGFGQGQWLWYHVYLGEQVCGGVLYGYGAGLRVSCSITGQ